MVVVAIVGAVTATVGNAAALTQTNVKRLLAYSSVAQAGYMLCAVAVPDRAAGAVLAYLAVYAVMNLGAFAVTAAVVARTGSEDVAAFAGLGRASPVLAASMLACLVSLIGLPPVGGFWAKLGVLVALSHAGAWGLALVAVVVANTVLSAFYYFRVIRAMYLLRGDAAAVGRREWVPTALGGLCGVALGVGFVVAGPLLRLGTGPAAPPAGQRAQALASVDR